MYAALPVAHDNLSLYLAEIRKFPMLDEQEEHRLAMRLLIIRIWMLPRPWSPQIYVLWSRWRVNIATMA